MPSNTQHISLPAQGRDTSLSFRFIVLVLDIVAIICLSVTLGLYYKWAPSRILDFEDDWTDPLVLGSLFLSITWIAFIYLRPASTSNELHPGHYVAWELICWVAVAACAVSALLMSNVINIADTSGDDDNEAFDCHYIWDEHYCWREAPRMVTVMQLQVASYAFALLIA